MTHTAKVRAEMQAIPGEKMWAKVRRTILGALFVLAAGWGGYAGWPWYVVAGLLAVGAHIISAELVQAAVKFAVATIKDLLAAVRNGKK